MVHQAADGSLAVIGWLFDIGLVAEPGADAFLTGLEEAVRARDDVDNSTKFDLSGLLPLEGQEFFRFQGSLTTPPCTEGLIWNVVTQPLTITQEQFDFIREFVPTDNSRSLQPLNSRSVLAGTVTSYEDALCDAINPSVSQADCENFPRFAEMFLNAGNFGWDAIEYTTDDGYIQTVIRLTTDGLGNPGPADK